MFRAGDRFILSSNTIRKLNTNFNKFALNYTLNQSKHCWSGTEMRSVHVRAPYFPHMLGLETSLLYYQIAMKPPSEGRLNIRKMSIPHPTTTTELTKWKKDARIAKQYQDHQRYRSGFGRWRYAPILLVNHLAKIMSGKVLQFAQD